MNDQARQLIEKQVRRVRFRLFLQGMLECVALSWAAALVLTTLWFLLRPLAFSGLGETARWAVPVSLLAICSIGGGVLAWLRRPSRMMSSLALDEKFGLKERVTTLLSLPADMVATPAGQALLTDVSKHLTNLEVSSRFPLRITLKQILMPCLALVLALAAFFVEPMLGNLLRAGTRPGGEDPRRVVDAKEIQKQMDELKKLVSERNNQEQLPKSEKLQELEREFEKLINQPVDAKNEEKVRERFAELRKLDDKMKARAEELQDRREKNDALKKQLAKLSLDKDAKVKEGPGKDFEDALIKGNLNKALDALEKLSKDLKNDKLTKEQQKELADQFKKLNEKLNNLLENSELMKQMKQNAKDGKLTEQEMQQFKDLKDLADLVNDARDALENKDGKDAGKELDKLAERFQQTELTEQEINDLIRDQAEIDEAMRILRAAMAGRDGEGDGDGLGAGGLPGRRRPIDPNDPDSKIRNQRQKAEADAKGQQRVTGYARGGNFNKVPATAVEGVFRQAVQEAPEAIDRQKIPDDARKIAQDYFRNLGNQK